MTVLQMVDSMQGGNRSIDQSTMDDKVASVDDNVVSDSECKYEVVSDDDYEIGPDDEDEVASDDDDEVLVKRDDELPGEFVEQTMEEIVIVEELIFIEEIYEEVVTENDDSDLDDMSNCSSVGDYDPNRPIVINPPDAQAADEDNNNLSSTADHQQISKAYLEDEGAAEGNSKKKNKSKKSKKKEKRSSKSKTKSPSSSTGDLSQSDVDGLEEDLEEKSARRKKKSSKSSTTSSKKSRSSRSKSRSRSKSMTRTSTSKSSGRSKSKTRSSSRSKLGKGDDNDSKKKGKGSSKRSVSVDEMELEATYSDCVAMTDLSALEAELNRSISLFTMQSTPNPDSLKEILANSGDPLASADTPARPSMGRRNKSMTNLELEKHPARARQSKERPRLRRRSRSRSKIHLLEGEEDDGMSSKNSDDKSMNRQHASLNDLQKLVSEMKTPSNDNATWDEPPKPPSSSSLEAILNVEKVKNGVVSETSSRTESTTMNSDILASPHPEKTNFPASPRRLVRAASLSKLMSLVPDDDNDFAMTPRSRRKKLSNLLLANKSSYETMEDDEEDVTLTPTSRRRRMMKLGGLRRHSARNLGLKPVL